MLLYDRVYGEHRLTDHALIDLLGSKPVQRLKGIAQFGVPNEWYHLEGFTRYEHSVGVMLLLDRMDAGLKEKIAGLLHDVSHTAFSHVIDWVYGNEKNEDFQDKILAKFMDSPDIKNVLEMYGYDSRDFHDLAKFTLLEQEIPDLCVDRVDYLLREMKFNGQAIEVEAFLKSLVNVDGRIYVKGEKAALALAREYIRHQQEHWAGEQARNRYKILADILKIAKDEDVVTYEDFFTQDRPLMEKLRAAKIKEIKDGIRKLETGKFKPDITLQKKLRYIDPLYFTERGTVKRLSETNFEFAEELAKLKEEYEPQKAE
jgi:HD superfamily phosphohydrolase